MAEPPRLSNSETSNILSQFPPAASLGKGRRARHERRYRSVIHTDLLEWLQQNEPADFADLMDLRRALYSFTTKGKYRIELQGHTQVGEQKIKLTGLNSAVLIFSNKSRHFLLRTLCRLRRARSWPPIKYR